MKNLTLTVILLFLMGIGQVKAADGFANGTGTESDPYQITTQADLEKVKDFLGAANSGKYFKLMDNITLTGMWTCIGTSTTDYFAGIFDGNGKTISGLQMNATAAGQGGLFGFLFSPGVIKNLTVTTTGDGVVSSAGRVGILVGQSGTGDTAATNPGGTISNCTVKGKVKSTANTAQTGVGGLIGVSKSIIENCKAIDVEVEGSAGVGGLVGNFTPLYKIENSSVTGKVKISGNQANVYSGGFVGYVYAATPVDTIRNCYADVNIDASAAAGRAVGGFLGVAVSDFVIENSSTISIIVVPAAAANQYMGGFAAMLNDSKGDILNSSAMIFLTGGINYSAGFHGYNRGGITKDCYATGLVKGNNGAGGFSGWHDPVGTTVSNTFAAVKVTGAGAYPPSAHTARGTATKPVVDSYYNSDIMAGVSDADALITGLPDADAKKAASYTKFDFTNDTWTIWEGKTMPYFVYQTTPVVVTITETDLTIEAKEAIAGYEVFELRNANGEVIDISSATAIDANTKKFDFPDGISKGDVFYVVVKETGKHPVGVFFEALEDTGPGGSDGFAKGTGTEEDPYQITTQADLELVKDFLGAANAGKYFKLMNDITLTGMWTCIGTSTTDYFAGIFDGNGKTISGLQMNATVAGQGGLFGFLFSPGVIKDLTVTTTGDGVVSSAGRVGILVGQSGTGDTAATNPGGTISNCTVKGKVKSTANTAQTGVGGLIGTSKSIIENCKAIDVEVEGAAAVGGLIGAITPLYKIENSSVTGKVKITGSQGNVYSGGFVGYAYAATPVDTIRNCYADVKIDASAAAGRAVGGFLGVAVDAIVIENSSTVSTITIPDANTYISGFAAMLNGSVGDILNSSSMTFLTGGTYSGGFHGYNRGKDTKDCYATGLVRGTNAAGGFSGWHDPVTVANTYAAVKVTGAGSYPPSAHTARGTATKPVVDSYYNSDIMAGVSDADALITGLPDADAKKAASYTKLDFTNDTWTIWEGKTMPYFTYQTTPVVVAVTETDFTIEAKNAINTYEIFELRNAKGEVIDIGSATTATTKTVDLPDGTLKGDVFYVVAKETGKHPVGVFFEALEDAGPGGSDGFAGGTGTEADPYQITNQEELVLVKNYYTAANSGKHFKLMNDIELTGMWTCIGTSTGNFFAGTFDGNNKTISGLQMNATTAGQGGLFGVFYAPGLIKDLTVITTGEGVVSTADRVGILVAQSGNGATVATDPGGTIINCTVSGKVKSSGVRVGGLIGMSKSIIQDCKAIDVEVEGSAYVGGFVGSHTPLYDIDNCEVTGKVKITAASGNAYSGGFIGLTENTTTGTDGKITNCYADVIVDGSSSGGRAIGGFVGMVSSMGILENCASINVSTISSTTASRYFGGFAGMLGNNGATSEMYYCSAMTYITGGINSGGSIGYNRGKEVQDCYATGFVREGDGTPGGFQSWQDTNPHTSNTYAAVNVSERAGGPTTTGAGAFDPPAAHTARGSNSDKLFTSYFDLSVMTAQAVDTIATGLSGAEAKTASSYAGFDFSNNTWAIWEGKTTPYFAFQTTPVAVTTTRTSVTIEAKNEIDSYEIFEVRNGNGDVIYLDSEDYIDAKTMTGDFPSGASVGDVFYVVVKETGKQPVGVFFEVADKGNNIVQPKLASFGVYFDAVGSLITHSSEPIGNITVVDLSGKTVYSAVSGQTTAIIPAQAWPAGVYVVKASGNNGVSTAKVIKI